MCVHAYTNELLDIHRNKSYENGKMSDILFNKLKMKKYNTNSKKDYYFIVLNKKDSSDIIVNSVKGLTILTPNINNLPFQVCWNKNRTFKYENITKKIKLFIYSLQKPKPSWKETFMSNIRTIDLDLQIFTWNKRIAYLSLSYFKPSRKHKIIFECVTIQI